MRLLLGWLVLEAAAIALFALLRLELSCFSLDTPPALVVLGALGASWLSAHGAAAWADRRAGSWRGGDLEAVLQDLASQPDAVSVGRVLTGYLRRVARARGATLRLAGREGVFAEDPPGITGPASIALPLGLRDADLGEVMLHGGRLRGSAHLRRVLYFGALALQNALLAETAAEADLASMRASSQRDLQARVTFAVSTQVYDVLGELRARLFHLREQLGETRSSHLASQLGDVAEQLVMLENLVQDNLRRVSGA